MVIHSLEIYYIAPVLSIFIKARSFLLLYLRVTLIDIFPIFPPLRKWFKFSRQLPFFHWIISWDGLNIAIMEWMRAIINCTRNEKLEQWCWLLDLHNVIERGGEIKFQDLGDWIWHLKWEVIDTPWTELKVIEKYSMPMVPHKFHYAFCSYHGFGSFWSVENGLYRVGERRSLSLVFFLIFITSVMLK